MCAVPQQEPRSIHVCYHAIIIIIILLFYFQCLALALVQISAEERESRTGGSGSLPSAPTAVYSLAETSAPLSPEAPTSLPGTYGSHHTACLGRQGAHHHTSHPREKPRCGWALAPESPRAGVDMGAQFLAGPGAQPSLWPPRGPHGAGPASPSTYLHPGHRQRPIAVTASCLNLEGPQGRGVPAHSFTNAEPKALGDPARSHPAS